MGLSLSAYYSAANGFVRNTATGTKQDGESSAGGRLKWSWRPTDVVKLDWTASYEYSDEDANPYYLLGKLTRKETLHQPNIRRWRKTAPALTVAIC